jgi:hypothetical protein
MLTGLQGVLRSARHEQGRQPDTARHFPARRALPTRLGGVLLRRSTAHLAMRPSRLQLSRRKGFRLHEASTLMNGLPVVKVARPGPWGNPFKVGIDGDATECVRRFEEITRRRLETEPSFLAPLRGKNLACFCSLQAPCHADVLLELANR